MNITDIVNNKVNRLAAGYVFTYADFNIPVNKGGALNKALNGLVKEGKVRKLSKGRFYKPRDSEFGELKPDVYQVVKDLLERDGKIKGYLTGYSTFNQLGLTTQVPAIVQIGANEVKKGLKRGLYQIRFIKQANRITKDNIPLLRILDAIQYIKQIPDSSIELSCKKLMELIGNIRGREKEQLVSLSLNYKPATRALTGAILEIKDGPDKVTPILNSLNPISQYKFNISMEILPNKQKWNIL